MLGGLAGIAQDGAKYLHADLVLILIAQPLGRMLGHGMGDLMAQDNGKRSLVLGDGQQPLEDHNLSTGHAEGIYLIVLHQVELPAVLLGIGSQPILV